LQQDWYFKDPDELEEDANFCELQYLHLQQFVSDVRALKRGKSIAVRRMDMRTFCRTNDIDIIAPGDFLLLEGMTLFRIPEVAAACDRRIYLSPGMAAIRRRKWRRDRLERGRSARNIQNQLAWVEREYRDDLVRLPPEVFVISGAMRRARIGNLAYGYIMGAVPRDRDESLTEV
jgi:uridine kinase